MAQAEIAFEMFVGQMSRSRLPRTNSKLPSFALLLIVVLTYLLSVSNTYLKIKNTSEKMEVKYFLKQIKTKRQM